jgi:hypothetical protein
VVSSCVCTMYIFSKAGVATSIESIATLSDDVVDGPCCPRQTLVV